MPWSPASVWAIRDANAEHLRTVDTFLQMAKARNVRDLLKKQDRAAGMPWVNTTAADRNGDVLYADHSVVPNVPDALAEECMTPTGRILDGLAGLPGLDGTRASCAWQTDEDASLVRAAREGDRRACEELFRRYAPWLRARLRQRCADVALLDDVVQDVFVAIWTGAARGD